MSNNTHRVIGCSPFNWYRTSGDSNNGLGTWYNNLQSTIKFQDWDEPVSQPGCWAYPDMLQVSICIRVFFSHS